MEAKKPSQNPPQGFQSRQRRPPLSSANVFPFAPKSTPVGHRMNNADRVPSGIYPIFLMPSISKTVVRIKQKVSSLCRRLVLLLEAHFLFGSASSSNCFRRSPVFARHTATLPIRVLRQPDSCIF